MTARKLQLLLLTCVLLALAGCGGYVPASPYYKPYNPGVPTPWADLPPFTND